MPPTISSSAARPITAATCCACCSMPASAPSATRRNAMRWRSTRARRSSTAASPPASTAWCSASWSTATPSASTTRARTPGRSAMPSGAGWWRSSPGRSPIPSSMRARCACSCPRSFRRCRRPRSPSWRSSSSSMPAALETTVAEFNAAVRPGSFDHSRARRLPHARPRHSEEPLGAHHRRAAVLRLSAAARASPSPISACA